MMFELVINLKAAEPDRPGLIPPNVLVRADKVIQWSGAECENLRDESDRDREKDMKKKIIVPLLFALCSLRFAFPAEAQQPAKVPRIGYLTGATLPAIPARPEAFRQGLRELGYVEGKNISIESPPPGAPRRADLVRLKVDVIVTPGATATRVAKQATSTIPIVMAQDPDPVGNGFVASLARPGGNITGLSNLNRELGGKRLELLKE